ncbi:MAG: SPFH domain-containing protein [Lachnospiraceae bacterium]|nr:SPFH domain-containing protein [Lachnospiraceae bacterium]MCM1236812.1 SPFH domain-containing protein [Ruminococcus flavefaciens]
MYNVTIPSGAVAVTVLVIVLLLIITIGYKKAPPDVAYIISGIRKRTVIGKATIKIPMLERLDKVSLRLIPIDVKTSNAVPTADYININVDAAVNIKVNADPAMIEKAAQNFLNKNTEYIAGIAREVLEGNMREIVGQMKLEEMVSDRQKFAEKVKENADPDLAAMGLMIISFNVQNFTDNNGVIDDLGIDNTEAIKKKAAIAKAESKRDISIKEAEADKASNDARVLADTAIAEKKNALAIKQSELKLEADRKKAEADAAYKIQEEAQRKNIEVAYQEAEIAKQTKEIELKQKMAEAAEQELTATVRKQAEADRFKAEQESDAERYRREREADAKLFEQQKEAEAKKAEADAELYRAQQQAAAKKAEAEGIRSVGEAEAAAIEAKGIAEAAAMEKKALAYQKYNNAAMAEMLIKVLPDIAGKIAEPLTQIDKITIISGGAENGIGNVADNVPAVMTKLFESMKETVGIDLNEIMKASTYDAKVNRNIQVSGLPEKVQDVTVNVPSPDLGNITDAGM